MEPPRKGARAIGAGKPSLYKPAEHLTRFASLLPSSGRALDVACGAGRHSLFLAGRGLRVVSVDRSLAALEEGRELARRQGVRLDWICADLESYPLPAEAFDIIVGLYYRDPTMYERLRTALRPGGLIFYETYTRDQLHFSFGPRNPAHLLEPGELLEAFGGWDLVFYRETCLERCVASIVTRKPLY